MKKYIMGIIIIIMFFTGIYFLSDNRDIILDEKSPDGKFSIIVQQRGSIFKPYGLKVYRKIEETGNKEEIADITIAQDLRQIVPGDISVTWNNDNEGVLSIDGETKSVYYYIGLNSHSSIY